MKVCKRLLLKFLKPELKAKTLSVPLRVFNAAEEMAFIAFIPIAAYSSFREIKFSLIPNLLFMMRCCTIEKILLTTQYNTKPDGKKKNVKPNISGIYNIIFACIGSAGFGLSLVCTNMVIIIKIGKIYSLSGDDKS